MSMGGAVPNVVLFNANGDRIAYHRNGGGKEKMYHNTPHDIMVDYFNPGSTETLEYITISASGPDALCITSVTVALPNTQEMWAFVPGEIAGESAALGHNWPWFYSDASVQIQSSDGKTKEGVRPRCFWIDRSGDYDGTYQEASVPFEGFQVHLPDFKLNNSKWKEWQGDLYQMCDSVARFGVFEHLNEKQCPQKFDPPPPNAGQNVPWGETPACHPDVWHSQPSDDPALNEDQASEVECMFGDCQQEPEFVPQPGKRSRSSGALGRNQVRRGTKRWAGQLVWSQDERASAVKLCKDPGSRGPDFYSEREQIFCDMDTHTLLPVCRNQAVDCFDPLQNVTRRGGNEKRELKPQYTAVKHWAKLNAA